MSGKVAYFVGTLQTGGIERSVTDWCLYLRKHSDWEPVVICLIRKSGPFVNVLQENGISVYECKVHAIGFVLRLSRLLRTLRPAVVHSQVAFSMPWQIIASKLGGVDTIVFTQQNEYQNWNPGFARLRIRLYFWIFDRFIDNYTCVSTRVRDSLSNLAGIGADRFIVIPNGVNTEVFRPMKEYRDSERATLGITKETFLAGMVARFSTQKGHSFLVEGVRLLTQRRTDFRIILVGAGDLQDSVARLISEANLDKYFIIMGRSLYVERLLQAFDCFILPSLWEGMPLALLEAMASGLPVIGTDVAGTREVIRDKENGLLIPSGDPAAIAESLDMLFNDSHLREKLSTAGVQSARTDYSVASNVDKYLRLYK